MNARNDITAPVRTIIADDHPLVLLAIENLMSTYPNMEVVGRATDSSQLFAEAGRVSCDLVVMDLYMPGGTHGDGLDMVREFRARFPEVVLVVLTLETEAEALQKIILPEEVCLTERTCASIISPMNCPPPLMTTIVPSSR